MVEYPRQDQKLVICTTDNNRLSGMINIAGRSISTYLQDSEPDIVMYDCKINDKESVDTLLVSKRQILWINSFEKREKDWLGNWQNVMFKMTNGDMISGEIDITGYDRVSDYLQHYNDRFYEVYDCRHDNKTEKLLFVSRQFTMWKQPNTE